MPIVNMRLLLDKHHFISVLYTFNLHLQQSFCIYHYINGTSIKKPMIEIALICQMEHSIQTSGLQLMSGVNSIYIQTAMNVKNQRRDAIMTAICAWPPSQRTASFRTAQRFGGEIAVKIILWIKKLLSRITIPLRDSPTYCRQDLHGAKDVLVAKPNSELRIALLR